jgi:hypothetical protein
LPGPLQPVNDEEPDPWSGDFNDSRQTDIDDITTFLAPVRRLDSSPGDTAYDSLDAYGRNGRRWDIYPGAGLFGKVINIQDLTAIISAGVNNRACTEATPNPPPATTSWYIVDGTYGEIQRLGCWSGRSAANGVVILDFGAYARQAGIYGTKLFNATFYSIDRVISAGLFFALGYSQCSTSSSKVKVVLGTNNSGPVEIPPVQNPQPPFSIASHASMWADRINSLNATLQISYGDKIEVWGGIDAEPNFGPPTDARQWADSYGAIAQYRNVNFGSADGCYFGSSQGATPLPCNNGWTQDDVYHISQRARFSVPMPEIYGVDGLLANQWRNLSVYGKLHDGFRLGFQGTLTQWQACDKNQGPPPTCAEEDTDRPPVQGWAELWHSVQVDPEISLPQEAYFLHSSDIERQFEY